MGKYAVSNAQIATSWSSDNGETWSKVTLLDVPNNNSGTDAVLIGRNGEVVDALQQLTRLAVQQKTGEDERIRIQENYDMTMETAIDEAREEGIEKGLEQGLERGLKQGLERGRHEERLELIHKMLSKGLSLEVVSDVTGLSLEELEGLLS